MLEPPYPASQAGLDAPRPADPRPSGPIDHRRADEDELLAALRAQDLLALAECWQRTAPAAHAVARRLLGAADQIEALLGEVYAELWESPPAVGPLERWARARTFARGAERLRAMGQGPAAPSCALVLPDLPAARRPATDPVERVIAELPHQAAVALVRAHDAGIPAAQQPDPQAPAGLDQALEALAQQTLEDGSAVRTGGEPLGDQVLGLSAAGPREQLADPSLAERLRFLRRGRRRLEGLPPAPELGPRVLLGVVARSQATAGPAAARPAADARPAAGEDDVVVTVARQSGLEGAVAAPTAAGVTTAHEDTGPIAVIAPEQAAGAVADWDAEFPVWPGDPEVPPGTAGPPLWTGAEADADLAAGAAPEAPAPRVRLGVGLLLIGTALGMLAGAVALVLR